MPGKRMIHDKICESRKVNSVDFYAECVWIRIMTKADDNGNYYRDVRRVHANCMLEKEGATEKATEKAIQSLLDAGLMDEYEADGRKYVHISNFHENQKLDGDCWAEVEHPLHPPSMGGAYLRKGKRREVWTDNRLFVDGGATESFRSNSGGQTEENRPKVKEEGKGKGEGKGEGELTELTSGDLKTFKTIFRDETGAKAKLGPKTGQTLVELHGRYGLTAVLEAIPHWVKDEGGKLAIQNDKRKREWACANFLRDAGEIIEAMKSGAFEPEPESAEAPKFGAAPFPEEFMR